MQRELGRKLHDGEFLFRQGEAGDGMYVIRSGRVEVFREEDGREIKLAELGEGDFFGEPGFDREPVRASSVRSKGDARVMTVDRKFFLLKFMEDPSFAFRILENMSRQIRTLNDEVCRLATSCLSWREH